MRLKTSIALSFISIIIITVVTACTGQSKKNDNKEKDKKKKHTSPAGYDLSNPITIKLPLELDEISGVTYYPKDTSVFAIQDENGLLYKIPLNNPHDIKKWKYNKSADYEDLVLLNETFFVLISNGDIAGMKFISEDSMQKSLFQFPFGKGNEFEILLYDESINKLRIICKECKSDSKKQLTTYLFDPITHQYSEDPLRIEVTTINQILDKEKMKFKPSGANINPLTNQLFIISAINKLLVVSDKNGNAVNVHKLDKANFKQPEGICFTTGGTMIISNEASDVGVANLLIFPYKPEKAVAQ